MLQADKQVLLAGVKRNALELRQKELDFNVERFTNLATQASVIAGFSFESLVELEVPEDTHWLLSSTYRRQPPRSSRTGSRRCAGRARSPRARSAPPWRS